MWWTRAGYFRQVSSSHEDELLSRVPVSLCQTGVALKRMKKKKSRTLAAARLSSLEYSGPISLPSFFFFCLNAFPGIERENIQRRKKRTHVELRYSLGRRWQEKNEFTEIVFWEMFLLILHETFIRFSNFSAHSIFTNKMKPMNWY